MLQALRPIAPCEDTVLDYDRAQLLIYAELISAHRSGIDWVEGSLPILSIDPSEDGEAARACWESHLARALWIRGAGLAMAIEAFGRDALPIG